MKKITFFLAILTTLAFPELSLAGNEFGGGFITEKNGETVLFDFFEYEIRSPRLVEYQDEALFQAVLKNSDMPVEMKNLIVWKLNEVFLVSPEFATQLAELFNGYRWRFVKLELKRIEDIGPSPIDLTGIVLNPVALRSDASKIIYISNQDFLRMNREHKVGLMFHEVIGAYFDRSYVEAPFGTDSSRARQIVARLFKGALAFNDLQDAFKLTGHRGYRGLQNPFDASNLFVWNFDTMNRPITNIAPPTFIYQERSELAKNLRTCQQFVQEAESRFHEYKLLALDYIRTTFTVYEKVRSNLKPGQYLKLPQNVYSPYLKIDVGSGVSYSHPLVAESEYSVCSQDQCLGQSEEKYSVRWAQYFDYKKLLTAQRGYFESYDSVMQKGRNKCDWRAVPEYPNEFYWLRQASPK